MLGKIKNSILACLIRFSYLENIHKFDKEIDKKISISENDFLKEGYLIKKNFLNNEELQNFQKFFINNRNLFDEKFIYLMDFVDTKFKKKISEFLGDDFILMGISIIKTTKDTITLSDAWHTDSVGHKINFHICVEGDGSIPTLYMPKTHTQKYIPSFMQELRSVYKFSQNPHKKNKVSFNHTKGDCTIFDANGKHMGYYKKAKGDRKLIFMEFMNKDKCNDLRYADNIKNPLKLRLKMPYRDQSRLFDFQIINDDIIEKLKKFKFFPTSLIRKYENKNYFQYSSLDIK
jgi:hypothetical protein